MVTVVSTLKEKQEVYTKFQSGNKTKAELAREYGVSDRSIRRWISEVEAASTKASHTTVHVIGDNIDEDDDKGVLEDTTSDTGNNTVDDDVEYRVLATRKSISLTRLVNDQVDSSVVIDKSSTNFQSIFSLIADSGMAQDKLEEAFYLAQPKKMVENFTQGKMKVDVKLGAIVYTPDIGMPFEVSGKLTDRIIGTIRKDSVEGAQSLINFLDKLMMNPSNRSVNELYGFLEHNDIEIAPNGSFYAWKVVRSDYMDKHSNTIDNSVGTEPRVNRNQVNENSEVTCSYGLHVCAKSYIKNFGNRGDRIVKVEVNPADVVSIPKDYNNAKMRCCGYKVIEDVTSQLRSHLS